MTAPSDLIRRGDAEAAIEAAKLDFQDPEDGLRAAGDAIRALPADPVAEAAGKLAELLMSDLDESESMGPAAWDEALTAVRAAVAARSAGTVPPAPAPVRPPAVRVPTPEEIAAMSPEQVAEETARLKRECGVVGGIGRCGTAGRTPEEIARGDLSALSIVARVERETFVPRPACARCGGSGWDRTLRYDGGGMKGEEFEPCPACRGKP